MTLPVFIVLATFAALAFKNLRAAFLLFIGALPSYVIRFQIAGVPTTMLEALFVILFAAWMLKREKRLIDIKGWGWLLLAWLAAATVSMFVAPDLRAAAGIWKAYFIEPILFFILANDFLRAQKDRDDAARALACAAAAVGGMAIFQHWTGWLVPPPFNGVPVPPATEAEFRSTSFYGFPNAVGLFLAPLAVLFSAQAFRKLPDRPEFRREHWFWVAAAWICIIAIFMAQSEGALIGLAVGLGVFGLLNPLTRKWTLGVGIAGVLLALALPFTRPVIVEKLALEDWSGRVRKEMWAETWTMLKAQPLFGAGLSGYPAVFDSYHKARHIEIFQYPHQLFLNFWVELGIAGVILLIAAVWRFIAVLRQACLRDPRFYLWTAGLASAMIALLVHGLVDVPYFKNDLAMLFWLLLALASSTLAEARRIDGNPKT